ncbi:hypothetical protein GOP47_0016119 [Adiantum capillus-veneris]|uniref:Uncharacterized protein n=1 Tax=Adiantum capillus-veneris TaxID=13818 RepID=A0A9D4ZBV0_ADICA|nr:hypothetical protein GOP47_0016119 [Adiantum capillus-veneris]
MPPRGLSPPLPPRGPLCFCSSLRHPSSPVTINCSKLLGLQNADGHPHETQSNTSPPSTLSMQLVVLLTVPEGPPSPPKDSPFATPCPHTLLMRPPQNLAFPFSVAYNTHHTLHNHQHLLTVPFHSSPPCNAISACFPKPAHRSLNAMAPPPVQLLLLLQPPLFSLAWPPGGAPSMHTPGSLTCP